MGRRFRVSGSSVTGIPCCTARLERREDAQPAVPKPAAPHNLGHRERCKICLSLMRAQVVP